jgi:integrase
MKHESQTKTRFGLRAVDLAPQIVNQLRFEPHNGELVFPNERGTFLSARDIHHVFRRVSRRAGLPLIHPHMLRHTWATLQLNSGTPLNYVSRALGHHSTAFTAGVYATAQPEPRREDVSRFAAAALRQPASPVPVSERDEARGTDAGAAADADAPELAAGDEVSNRTH